jgi:hypothetical protein
MAEAVIDPGRWVTPPLEPDVLQLIVAEMVEVNGEEYIDGTATMQVA